MFETIPADVVLIQLKPFGGVNTWFYRPNKKYRSEKKTIGQGCFFLLCR